MCIWSLFWAVDSLFFRFSPYLHIWLISCSKTCLLPSAPGSKLLKRLFSHWRCPQIWALGYMKLTAALSVTRMSTVSIFPPGESKWLDSCFTYQIRATLKSDPVPALVYQLLAPPINPRRWPLCDHWSPSAGLRVAAIGVVVGELVFIYARASSCKRLIV